MRLCDKSRMTGDCHVRFRERLGGEIPPAYSTVKCASQLFD